MAGRSTLDDTLIYFGIAWGYEASIRLVGRLPTQGSFGNWESQTWILEAETTIHLRKYEDSMLLFPRTRLDLKGILLGVVLHTPIHDAIASCMMGASLEPHETIVRRPGILARDALCTALA
jgi:hypothetical protein